jgi:hypothetical protein
MADQADKTCGYNKVNELKIVFGWQKDKFLKDLGG